MPKGSEGCPNLRNSQKAAAKAHKGPACHICLASLEDALEEDMRVQEIILLRNNPMKERRCPLLAISNWLLWWCFCILYLCNPLWGNCGEAAIKADIWACDLIRLFGFSDYTGQFVLWNNSVYREELWRCFSVWVRVEQRVKRCSGRTRAEALTSCGHWGTENAFGTRGSFAPRDFVVLCELNLQKTSEKGKVHHSSYVKSAAWLQSLPLCMEIALSDFQPLLKLLLDCGSLLILLDLVSF